jgi:mttA/Hcf106 family
MKSFALITILFCMVALSYAFVTPNQRFHGVVQRPLVKGGVLDTVSRPVAVYQPASLQRQRKSVASVQTMGIFGLGAPEIAIILVAAAFLLGPQKLAEFGRDAGKVRDASSSLVIAIVKNKFSLLSLWVIDCW